MHTGQRRSSGPIRVVGPFPNWWRDCFFQFDFFVKMCRNFHFNWYRAPCHLWYSTACDYNLLTSNNLEQGQKTKHSSHSQRIHPKLLYQSHVCFSTDEKGWYFQGPDFHATRIVRTFVWEDLKVPSKIVTTARACLTWIVNVANILGQTLTRTRRSISFRFAL